MGKTLSFILVLGTFAFVSATFPTLQPRSDLTQVPGEPLATTLSRWLVDMVSEKIAALARFFDLKLRVVRFLVSLYTTENLVLFRNLVEYGLKVGNFTLRFLPTSTEDPGYWWIPALTQLLNANVGSGGIFGLALGEPSVAGSDDLAEESSENTANTSNDPPIFYNAPANSTEHPGSNDVDSYGTSRKSRSAAQETRDVNENISEISEDVSQTHDDILKAYQGRIMTLDKLINSRKK